MRLALESCCTSLALAALMVAVPLAHAIAPVAPAPAPATASAPSPPLSDACPAQLPVRQTVAETIDGWTPLNQQGSYPFLRVAFYPGAPRDTNLIVPSVEYKGQSGLHDAWDLPRRTEGYWMTCAYANTTATVSRKLADDVDFCQADYDGRFLTLVVKHWTCGVKRTMALPAWTRPRTPRPATRPPVRRAG